MQNGTINRRDAETQSFNELTERVIGACIEIHRALGPGLLEISLPLKSGALMSLKALVFLKIVLKITSDIIKEELVR